MQKFILHNFYIDHRKYKLYDSASENSEDEERRIEIVNDDIENIIGSLNKVPSPGTITFIAKINNPRRI